MILKEMFRRSSRCVLTEDGTALQAWDKARWVLQACVLPMQRLAYIPPS